MQDHDDKEERGERREKTEDRLEEAARGPQMRPPEGGQPFSTSCCHLFGLISGPRAEGREQRKERRDKREEIKLPPARFPACLLGPVATSKKF